MSSSTWAVLWDIAILASYLWLTTAGWALGLWYIWGQTVKKEFNQ